MNIVPMPMWKARERLDEQAARQLAEIATTSCQSLARIARAYEDHTAGVCDQARLIEVVRQEVQRMATQPRQATRRSGPVRG